MEAHPQGRRPAERSLGAAEGRRAGRLAKSPVISGEGATADFRAEGASGMSDGGGRTLHSAQFVPRGMAGVHRASTTVPHPGKGWGRKVRPPVASAQPKSFAIADKNRASSSAVP